MLWIISNLVDHNEAIAEKIFGRESLIADIILLLKNDSVDVKKEAIIVLKNGCVKLKQPNMIAIWQRYEIMAIVANNLILKDKKAELEMLTALRCFLGRGRGMAADNELLNEFEKNGGTAALESLQYSPALEVYETAVNIIQEFYIA